MENRSILNFTVAGIEQLPCPDKGTHLYRDRKNNSLQLYVTAKGAKTFFVRKRVNGRDERLIIGRFPLITIEQARKKALLYCGLIANKQDPIQQQRRDKSDRLTFGEHFNEYMERYSKLHKKSWKYDEDQINRHVSQWFKKRLTDIAKADVQRLHEKIGRESGKVQANNILRRLSAIFNKAIEWGWQGTNPTKGIKRFREMSRDRFILPHEIPFLLRAIEAENNETHRDYIFMLLLTGARKTNTRMMRWEQIDRHRKEWRIPDSKNCEPVIVPLTGQVIEILDNRKKDSTAGWVFPQDKDSRKCIVDPIKAWHRIIAGATMSMWEADPTLSKWVNGEKQKLLPFLSEYLKVQRLLTIAEDKNFALPSGLMDVRIHDIRRTFGSYQAIAGASLQVIGKSLGHKSMHSTQIYARLNLDTVRASVEAATNTMFQLSKQP